MRQDRLTIQVVARPLGGWIVGVRYGEDGVWYWQRRAGSVGAIRDVLETAAEKRKIGEADIRKTLGYAP